MTRLDEYYVIKGKLKDANVLLCALVVGVIMVVYLLWSKIDRLEEKNRHLNGIIELELKELENDGRCQVIVFKEK